MEPTLDDSIKAMFGTGQPKAAPGKMKLEPEEITQAKERFEDVRKAMQQGDWEAFGKAMKALSQLLK